MLHSARMLLLMASDHPDCERVLAAASQLVCSAAWHGEPVWRHRHCECVLSCACRLQQAYSRVTPIVWLSWQLHAVTQRLVSSTAWHSNCVCVSCHAPAGCQQAYRKTWSFSTAQQCRVQHACRPQSRPGLNTSSCWPWRYMC